jgi:cysteinyl-tRNA synthetase
MARKYLGDTLDIHTGGEDNAFPHHECEIAQSESLTGKPFVNYWLHTRFLLVDGAKMSKSKGTMYVVEDVEARGVPTRVLRYFLLSAHYRAAMNFTWEALDGARSAVDGFDAMVRGLASDANSPDRSDVAGACEDASRSFLTALQDDLNISEALSAVHRFRAFVNKSGPYSPGDFARIRTRIAEFDSVLGLDLVSQVKSVDAEIDGLVANRQFARKAKDFVQADNIRKLLDAMGVVVEDTPTGVRWFRK